MFFKDKNTYCWKKIREYFVFRTCTFSIKTHKITCNRISCRPRCLHRNMAAKNPRRPSVVFGSDVVTSPARPPRTRHPSILLLSFMSPPERVYLHHTFVIASSYGSHRCWRNCKMYFDRCARRYRRILHRCKWGRSSHLFCLCLQHSSSAANTSSLQMERHHPRVWMIRQTLVSSLISILLKLLLLT